MNSLGLGTCQNSTVFDMLLSFVARVGVHDRLVGIASPHDDAVDFTEAS
jgi:hypothetical protein